MLYAVNALRAAGEAAVATLRPDARPPGGFLRLTGARNWRGLAGRMDRSGSHGPPLLSRATALLAVCLVLALSVFAASPELHERLHGHPAAALVGAHAGGIPAGQASDAQDDDGCVVTLFAQGLVLALALVALAFTGQTLRLGDSELLDRIIPESPRYLLLPTQAPPLGLD